MQGFKFLLVLALIMCLPSFAVRVRYECIRPVGEGVDQEGAIEIPEGSSYLFLEKKLKWHLGLLDCSLRFEKPDGEILPFARLVGPEGSIRLLKIRLDGSRTEVELFASEIYERHYLQPGVNYVVVHE